MKCQILFPGKNENISECRLLKLLPRVLSIYLLLGIHDYIYFFLFKVLTFHALSHRDNSYEMSNDFLGKMSSICHLPNLTREHSSR